MGEKYTIDIAIETILKSTKPSVEYENVFIILVLLKNRTVAVKTIA